MSWQRLTITARAFDDGSFLAAQGAVSAVLLAAGAPDSAAVFFRFRPGDGGADLFLAPDSVPLLRHALPGWPPVACGKPPSWRLKLWAGSPNARRLVGIGRYPAARRHADAARA